MVRDGKFREDLYFRLNVFPIRIPPLRERFSDVEQIADGWWLRHRRCHLTRAQLKVLMTYDYPGNVRELYNLLECADVMDEHDFDKLIADQQEMLGNLSPKTDDDDTPDELEAVIRRHVRRVYEKYGHNISQTADALNVARNTVKKYLGQE